MENFPFSFLNEQALKKPDHENCLLIRNSKPRELFTNQKFKATRTVYLSEIQQNEELCNENVSYNFGNISPDNGHEKRESYLLEDHEREMD